MDRYLEDADPEKKLRSKQIHSRLSACRDRINALTQEHVSSRIFMRRHGFILYLGCIDARSFEAYC